MNQSVYFSYVPQWISHILNSAFDNWFKKGRNLIGWRCERWLIPPKKSQLTWITPTEMNRILFTLIFYDWEKTWIGSMWRLIQKFLEIWRNESNMFLNEKLKWGVKHESYQNFESYRIESRSFLHEPCFSCPLIPGYKRWICGYVFIIVKIQVIQSTVK